VQALVADLKSWWAKTVLGRHASNRVVRSVVGFFMLAWLVWAIIVGHILKGLPSGRYQ